MGIEYIILLLTAMKAHITDIVLIMAIVALFVYQMRNSKVTHTNTKEARDACDRMEKKANQTIPSISRRMISIVKSSATINRELDKMVWELDADRGWVYLFHNSGYDFIGQPFCKITNTNESLNPGAPSVMEMMKEIPVGSLACFIEYLLDYGEIRVPNIEQFKAKDRTAYSYFYNLGIYSTYAVMLYAPKVEENGDKKIGDGRQSRGEVPLGIVGVDYLKEQRDLDEFSFKEFHSSAMIIKGLLLERRREEIEDE